MSSLSGLEQLRAAAIDGRTENVRHRQNEIQKLHLCLRENAATILSSITKDSDSGSSNTSLESEAEFWLTMNAVEQQYDGLDFEASIKQEYLIVTGANNQGRRIGKGVVVIRPTTHTRFYSIIVPLVTAIAAGSCTALELADTMLNVDSVLKDILPKSLDPDTFCIINATLYSQEHVFLVDQTARSNVSSVDRLCSNYSARAIAIVDRDADIEFAAKTIVKARFSFQGTSPYSPDLIVVNEYIKDEFTEACSRYAGKFFPSMSKSIVVRNNNFLETKKALKAAEEKGEVTISGTTLFKIVDIHDRSCPMTKMKISGYCLSIISSSSLVDSVSISKLSPDLLALYTFSDPATAKFLAQHVNAHTSFANSIPSHILVGPAAPITPVPAPPHHKYSSNMFTSPRPQYIVLPAPSSDLALIDDMLSRFYEPLGQSSALVKLRGKVVGRDGKAAKILKPKNAQPQGGQLGFFEQGVLLGAGLVLSVIISTVIGGIWVFKRSMKTL
ncbi:hypothetical protein V501_09104 [Pseudogymnoascus sp. VKM F-4519 (FW-2642)]|nr:hypothetical protein V501_09104 [Pseudogymnoascus sp. VKM F-4519 (FW-2642)]